MRSSKHSIRILVIGTLTAVLALSAVVWAQNGVKAAPASSKPIDPSYGTFNFNTHIGSFKLLDGVGKVEVSFTGTLLVSQLKGTVVPSGELKREYPEAGQPVKDKVVWHGTGKVILDGTFRAVQWFGTNMTGKWVGRGRARIYGEFDQNLETGKYWYDDPTKKSDWSMYGMEIQVPEFQQGGTGVPKERKPGGGG